MTVSRLLHGCYLALLFIPLMLPFTLCILVCICITSLFSKRLAFTFWIRYWARLFCWFTPLQVRRTGLDNIAPHQSYVVVVNHASQYDIPLVAGWVPLDLKWVGKMELKNTLIVGTAGKAIGAVFIDRSDREAAIANLDAIKARIIGGTSIIFFPEGTRSKIGKLLPFKRGAFVMAKDLNLPILPISLINTDKILPSGAMFPYAGEVELCVHPPIAAADVAALDLTALTAKARELVASRLASE